ncbi:MAG: O-antigen ligase family protein [Crocinitomicaceae bacterium]|nr:O-antigen ligase family protein [Crocinitomicaceae bacterium]
MINNIKTGVLLIYLALVIVVDLLLPKLGFISLSNLLFPIVLIVLGHTYFKDKTFLLIGSLVILYCLFEVFVNFYNAPLTTNEISYVLRPLKLFAIGYSTYFLMQKYAPQIKNLLLFSFIGVAVIVALQLLGISSIIDWYVPQKEIADSLKFSLFDARVIGVFINPNNLGLFALLSFVFVYKNDMNYKKELLLLLFLLMLFSQSRTVIIAFIVIILLEFIRFKKVKINYWYLLAFFALIIGIGLSLPNTRSLFTGDAFHSNSFLKRFFVIDNVLQVNKESFVLGKGHINDIISLVGGSIDNEYAYIYLEYGIIGLILTLLGFAGLFIGLYRKSANYITIYLFVILLIAGFTNLSFSNYEILPFMIVFCVLSLVSQRKEAEKLK